MCIRDRLQLLPARPPGHCRCRRRARGHRIFRANPAGDHRHPRETDRRTRGARLRGPTLRRQLHLRPPSTARCRATGAGAAQTKHHRPPFQTTAHRPVPAHHGRRRCGMQGADRGPAQHSRLTPQARRPESVYLSIIAPHVRNTRWLLSESTAAFGHNQPIRLSWATSATD